MKGNIKRRVCVGVAACAVGASPLAVAGIPVFDAMNFASNLVQNFQLKHIKKQLSSNQQGTVNYNIGMIDKSTTSISNETTTISKLTVKNFDIDMSFKWIIKKGGGGEIIPIPRNGGGGKEALLGDRIDSLFAGGAGEHVKKFGSATDYGDTIPSSATADVASQVRKDANDILAYSLDAHRAGLNEEAQQLSDLIELSVSEKAQGHGKQLQLANALAGSQANQLVQLRSLMLAAESARMAELESSADREARELATSRALRKGLGDASRSLRTASAEP